MDEEGVPLKEVFNAQPTGTQRKDRPNLRWFDGLEKDLLVLRTKNWRTQAGRRLLEKTKALYKGKVRITKNFSV
ncbi:hypothetical protein TNCV_3203451 [Trichonephila clavipes]|nr:hypothetical protein TNCV_3203451 [Trichonephila clavipes]